MIATYLVMVLSKQPAGNITTSKQHRHQRKSWVMLMKLLRVVNIP